MLFTPMMHGRIGARHFLRSQHFSASFFQKGQGGQKKKIQIKHYLVAMQYTGGCTYLLQQEKLPYLEVNVLCPDLSSFPAILVAPVATVCTVQMLKRLTNNSAVVLCMCRTKFPDYKQKRENYDRLDDFKLDLRPIQLINVCSSLHEKTKTATKHSEGSSDCYCYCSD